MIHSNENRLHTGSLSLLTDLYQLTIATSYARWCGRQLV